MSMTTEQVKRLRVAANRFDAEGAEPSDGDLMREAANTIAQLAAKVRIENGFIFPENPTNGDMIKTLFPCEDLEEDFDSEWWNSPYKRGEME